MCRSFSQGLILGHGAFTSTLTSSVVNTTFDLHNILQYFSQIDLSKNCCLYEQYIVFLLNLISIIDYIYCSLVSPSLNHLHDTTLSAHSFGITQ